jgi:hypothetical protein
MKMLTMKKLDRFVKVRNRSGFPSNLQFQIDANECGFEVSELGDVRVFHIDGSKGYEWKPVIAKVSVRNNIKQERTWLVEFFGKCYLNDHDDQATRDMFDLMKRAEYQKAA